MFDGWKTVLIISSHTDDAELAMGGTINRLVREGSDVYHLVLSNAKEQSKKRGYDWNVLSKENAEANKILKTKLLAHYNTPNSFDNPYIPTDYFDKYRQNIANILHEYKEIVNPDIVFVNSSQDSHQDHQVTHNEAKRIFKDVGLLGYEFPYNNISFNYDMIVKLNKEDIQTKIEAMRCFKSQQDRVYFNEDYIWGLAKVNAVRVKIENGYAEAFEVIRLVW